MMNIIAASRLRAQNFEFNTFIKGMSDFLLTKQGLVNRTNLSVNEIDLFENNLETKASINQDYGASFSGRSTPENNNLKAYIDLGGFFKSTILESFFGGDGEGKANPFYLLNSLENIAGRCFENNINIIGSFHNATTINSSAFNQGTNGEIYVDKSLETADSGSPLPALVTFVNNGGTIIYRDSKNSNQITTPPAATISANTIGGNYVVLNVPQPAHVNSLKYALVFVDGFFQDVYDINSEIYAVNLQEQTSYNIKIIIADEYFNISPYSNALNITTTTNPALFQNAVAYYRLNETSGDAIDLVNSYNGTLFGGVTQGVTGKIGTAYSFNGVDGYIELSDNDHFSFTDGINDIAFTIRCWVNLNSTATQMLWGKAEPGSAEYYFRIASGKISLQLFSEADPNIFIRKNTVGNVIINQWTHIVATYDGSNIKIYQNAVEESTTDASLGAYAGMSNTNTSVQISRNKFVNDQFIDGFIDEITIIKGEAWTSGKISDDYNNGSGTTI